MFNRTILMGNLTRDVELRYLQGGSAVASTGLAINRRYKKQDGGQGEEVCFIDITFFGRTAEIANQYLSRGRRVLIEGRLKFEQWTDQQGVKRSKHTVQVESVQMIGEGSGQEEGGSNGNGTQPRNQGQGQPRQQPNNAPQRQPQGGQQGQFGGHNIPDIDINDDEIPF